MSKKQQFFPSLMKQKVDTLRWCIKYGGCDPCVTQDEQGHAALETAAARGLLKSLRTIVETMERSRDRRMDFQFDPAGMTAVMLASANGHLDCVKLLVNYSASLTKKCPKGKTARDYAEQQNKRKVVAYIDDELGEGDDDEEEEDIPDDGLSNAQRAKQKRKEKERLERGLTKEEADAEEAAAVNARAAQKTEKWSEEEAKLAALSAAAKAGTGDKGIWWSEISAILVGSGGKLQPLRELNILRGTPSADLAQAEKDLQGYIDPFLWKCYFLNRLQLKLPLGTLVELPPEIGQMRDMQTLILSENSLKFLPEAIGDLASLKILEVDKNKLEDLPRSLAQLKQLEVLNVSSNSLEDLGSVKEILTLTSLNASGNKLTSVQLPFAEMPRLQMLSASDNPITELDPAIGQIQAAVTINFSDCLLKSVPGQIGDIKAKHLQVLSFMGNPLKDNRLKKIMKGVEEGNKPMKELLNYLKKQPKAKQQAKQNPKTKAAPPPPPTKDDSDDDDDDDIDLDDI